MNPLKIEAERAIRSQALPEDARVARTLKQAGANRHSFPLGVVLSIVGLAISLAVRFKGWFLAGGAQGYLPNVHID
jgi:hypothetical protein